MADAGAMYVKAEPDGSFSLRQERYRGRKKEHPNDVCAVGRSLQELREMCEPYFLKVKWVQS